MKTALFSIAVLALLGACSAPAPEDTSEPVALVKVANTVRQSVGESVTLYGVADAGPGGQASLVAPIEARLMTIEAPAGTAVRQGQTVMRLSPGPTATLDIAKARSDAQTANAAFARAQRLRVDGLMSDADVETARAAKSSANAALQSLTGRSLTLRAPIAGHVEGITAQPGDIVAAGNTIGSISGNGAVRVRFGVDPAQIGAIQIGAPVTIARAGGGERLRSQVSSVDPIVDPQMKLASIYVNLPAASQGRKGEAMTGKLTLSHGPATLVVPYAALLDDAGQPYVFVITNGVAHRRDITTGPDDGQNVAVLRGLSAGSKVVVEGGTALEDGMKVRLK